MRSSFMRRVVPMTMKQNVSASTPITYLLRDVFSDTLAAGAVNGTAPTPGPGGNRRVVDVAGTKITSGSGYFNIAAGSSYGDGIAWSTAVDRILGRVFSLHFQIGIVNVGFATTTTLFDKVIGWNFDGANMRAGAGNYQKYDGADLSVAQKGMVAYNFIIVLKPTGAWLFVQGGKYPYPTLVYYDRVNASATIYPGMHIYSASAPRVADAIVADGYIPTALCSDAFTRADAAVGGIWTERVGTGAVSTNTCVITPSTSVGILTAEAGKADTFVVAKVTRSGGSVGIITHYVDTDNYLRIIHDGTNLKIIQRVGGSESDLASAAVAYSAGKDISCETRGNTIRAWYNANSISNTAPTMNAALVTSTLVGLWSSDAGNIIDDFEAYARGSANEHSGLSPYIHVGAAGVFCEGDSLTAGNATEVVWPIQLAATYGTSLEITNYAVGGTTVATMVTNGSAYLDGAKTYWTKAIVCLWGGSNDLSASVAQATVYNNIVSYCNSRKASGFKVLVFTILPRTGIAGANETARVAINALIVANWASYADGVVDVAADARFSDYNDTTYFQADKTHLTDAGETVVAGLAKTEIDKLL